MFLCVRSLLNVQIIECKIVLSFTLHHFLGVRCFRLCEQNVSSNQIPPPSPIYQQPRLLPCTRDMKAASVRHTGSQSGNGSRSLQTTPIPNGSDSCFQHHTLPCNLLNNKATATHLSILLDTFQLPVFFLVLFYNIKIVPILDVARTFAHIQRQSIQNTK